MGLRGHLFQILNKGRGAGMRITVATQTISDFISALGSDAKEEMVLGNVNNVIALRTKNPTSQEFITKELPDTVVRTITHSQGVNSLTTVPLLHGATQSEQLKETPAPLVPPQLFGLLPNLEFIAKFADGNILKGRLPIVVASKNATNTDLPHYEEDFYINLDVDHH